MEVNAALAAQNVFTEWAARQKSGVWVAPVPARRGVEVGLVVAERGDGLDTALLDAAGAQCRHTVERVARDGPSTCLRYRCSRAGAPGCRLLGDALGTLRPLLGNSGFVQSIRFEKDGGNVRMVWPPGGPDAADALRQEADAHADALGRIGFRFVDVRDSTRELFDEAHGAPRLKGPELETLLVALQNGYYESPRRCTMEDLASHFGLSKSAIYHRMHAAEREAVRNLAAGRATSIPRWPPEQDQ